MRPDIDAAIVLSAFTYGRRTDFRSASRTRSTRRRSVDRRQCPRAPPSAELAAPPA